MSAIKKRNFASPLRQNRSAPLWTIHRKQFATELQRQLRLHGEGHGTELIKMLSEQQHSNVLLTNWLTQKTRPRSPASFRILTSLERRYKLPKDHFRSILMPLTPTDEVVRAFPGNDRSIIRWHLPKDFDTRPPKQRQRIVAWLKANVLSGVTDFGKYQSSIAGQRFALRLPALHDLPTRESFIGRYRLNSGEITHHKHPIYGPLNLAPDQLVDELEQLVKFKRSTIAPSGTMRTMGWTKETAFRQTRCFARLFGALVASPQSLIRGFGAPRSCLTLGLFVFPAFWDWALNWYETRRGFFTAHERGILIDTMSLLRAETGWIRQNPYLAEHLVPIRGMLTANDIQSVKEDWSGACDKVVLYMRARLRELRQIIQVHRDGFEPIIAVLKLDTPLREYRKIADELLRCFPNDKKYPVAAAEHARAYLLLRFGMQLGLRSRNLRQLLICERGNVPRGDKTLKRLRRGELRWSAANKGWEVYIPSLAFKNWNSNFFRSFPFCVTLPNVHDLYYWIAIYLKRYRPILLGGYSDPGTFFVRTVCSDQEAGEFNSQTLNYVWRDIVTKYGIYNPFTKRGAIEGLLPHGPHAIRDVIATHLVKQTSSYDLTAYALHSTPKVIERHYCRFLAEEKATLAAKMLSEIWN